MKDRAIQFKDEGIIQCLKYNFNLSFGYVFQQRGIGYKPRLNMKRTFCLVMHSVSLLVCNSKKKNIEQH